ncbi:MAG: hypothetical protein M9893_02320 [Pyrinomonadaceae bacterium]|nr:hypothetical protein [Pyrinomonadaceae bacterium]
MTADPIRRIELLGRHREFPLLSAGKTTDPLHQLVVFLTFRIEDLCPVSVQLYLSIELRIANGLVHVRVVIATAVWDYVLDIYNAVIE